MEENKQNNNVTLALYSKLLHSHAGSHHGSHEQDTAYYDRFGETILSSQPTREEAIAHLSSRPDFLEQGLNHVNPEVIVITLRIAALLMASDLPPSPDTHPSFFARYEALLRTESSAGVSPRIREAAMNALSRGCNGAKVSAWTAQRLTDLINSLASTMADGSLHRIAASASALLASLVLRFGQSALLAVDVKLGALLDSKLDGSVSSSSPLKLSTLDFITTLLSTLRAPYSILSSLLSPPRQTALLNWLTDADLVVRSRTASALIVLSRSNSLPVLGGEQLVLDFAKKLTGNNESLPFAAELLGGLAFSCASLSQTALDHLAQHFTSLSTGDFNSRQRCVALASLLGAIDTRASAESLPPPLAASILTLLRVLHIDASSLAAPQRLFKTLLRLIERRTAHSHVDHSFLHDALLLLLIQLRSLHNHRLHQLEVQVIQSIGVLVPALVSPTSLLTAAAPLAEFAPYAASILAATDGSWELRDSIAELLGKWIALPALRPWCLQSAFVSGLSALASQPELEPFVYTTVASTFTAYGASTEGWQFMAANGQAYLACCSAALVAEESLLRRSAITEMLGKALHYPHAEAALRAYISSTQCKAVLSRLAVDDDFEVRLAVVKLLSNDLWPGVEFFEVNGDTIFRSAVC